MTFFIQSVTSIVAGTNTTLSTAGDDFHLLSGVTLGSTDAVGIRLNADDMNLRIDGTVTAALAAIDSATVTGNFRVVIGASGIVNSMESSSGSFGVALRGGSSDLINHGQISAPEAIAVFMRESGNELHNYGTIAGVTGVQLFSFSSDNYVYNAGTISGSGSFDGSRDPFEGTGILVQSQSSTIVNAAGGRIFTSAASAPAITADGAAGGLMVENRGEISAALGTGVNLALVDLGQARISVINHGVISAGEGSYVGSVNADTLRNLGEMEGAVEMGTGDDTLENRGGTILGDLDLGAGADVLDNRGGLITGSIFGDAGTDNFILGAGIEVIDGSDDFDSIDFRGTPAVTVALDGSLPNTGHAAGDEYTGIEGVFGSYFADVLIGSSGANTLRGFGGNDTMNGGAGADKLVGGNGIDTITTGAGSDTIIFDRLSEIGDLITDFNAATDVFNIRASAFGGGLVAGVLAATQFQSRADNLAQDGDDRFIFRTTDRTIWFDADGNGAGAAILVADLQAGATVTVADIVLI